MEQYADGDESFKSDCTIVRNVLKPSKELSPMITSRIPETGNTEPSKPADESE